jgi:hypothetical protein
MPILSRKHLWTTVFCCAPGRVRCHPSTPRFAPRCSEWIGLSVRLRLDWVLGMIGARTRWRVEENIRFIKQSYGLEDIRLLIYELLRIMAALVMAAACSACVFLGRKTTLRILVHNIDRVARRIYSVPAFRFYAVADGIKELLFARPGLPRTPLDRVCETQISLLPQGP